MTLAPLTPEQKREEHYRMLLYFYECAEKLIAFPGTFEPRPDAPAEFDEDAAYRAWEEFVGGHKVAKEADPGDDVVNMPMPRFALRMVSGYVRNGWTGKGFDVTPFYRYFHNVLQYSVDGGTAWMNVEEVHLGKCENEQEMLRPST